MTGVTNMPVTNEKYAEKKLEGEIAKMFLIGFNDACNEL
jgi:hypothetical protein